MKLNIVHSTDTAPDTASPARAALTDAHRRRAALLAADAAKASMDAAERAHVNAATASQAQLDALRDQETSAAAETLVNGSTTVDVEALADRIAKAEAAHAPLARRAATATKALAILAQQRTELQAQRQAVERELPTLAVAVLDSELPALGEDFAAVLDPLLDQFVETWAHVAARSMLTTGSSTVAPGMLARAAELSIPSPEHPAFRTTTPRVLAREIAARAQALVEELSA